MEKFSTVKKLKNKMRVTKEQCVQIEKTIDSTVSYIELWTRKELLAMAMDSNLPLCIPAGKSGYLIGKYKIKKKNDFWIAQNIFNTNMLCFSSRSVAVIYALCDHQGYCKLAEEILRYSTKTINISEDILIYNYYKNSAKRNKDAWRVDHYTIMEDSAKYKLNDAKHQLEKRLHLAKYFKIQWE
jgi:hypothetical protein